MVRNLHNLEILVLQSDATFFNPSGRTILFYIATCDLLLSVHSVEFYPQVTEYATYKKQTTVLEQFGHGSGRFN